MEGLLKYLRNYISLCSKFVCLLKGDAGGEVKNSSKSRQRSLRMAPKAIEYKWDIFDNCFKVCKDRNKASLYILTHPTGWCYYCNCKYFNDNSRRGGSSDKNSLTLSRKRNRNHMRVSKVNDIQKGLFSVRISRK